MKQMKMWTLQLPSLTPVKTLKRKGNVKIQYITEKVHALVFSFQNRMKLIDKHVAYINRQGQFSETFKCQTNSLNIIIQMLGLQIWKW